MNFQYLFYEQPGRPYYTILFLASPDDLHTHLGELRIFIQNNFFLKKRERRSSAFLLSDKNALKAGTQ